MIFSNIVRPGTSAHRRTITRPGSRRACRDAESREERRISGDSKKQVMEIGWRAAVSRPCRRPPCLRTRLIGSPRDTYGGATPVPSGIGPVRASDAAVRAIALGVSVAVAAKGHATRDGAERPMLEPGDCDQAAIAVALIAARRDGRGAGGLQTVLRQQHPVVDGGCRSRGCGRSLADDR